MKKGAVPFFALLLAAPLHAESAASPDPPDLREAILWSLIPGGGHFYLGNTGAGVAYATATAVFLAGGLEVQRRNDRLGRDDEANVPLLLADKVWEYSIFSTFREAATRTGMDLRAGGFDDTPTPRLLLAPFHPGQFLRPEVLGAALLGVAGAALSHDHDGGQLADVDRVGMLGASYERDDATRLYAAATLGISLGAGVSEEALFRGVLQPVLQNSMGTTRGLWGTAALFGAAHIVGVDGELNVEGALFATGAGAYLGWLYNRDGNRLAGPIAAHFWYDFMLLAASWALDPDDTPLGFDVQFRF